ncbi:NfeD family protein [Armatimonas sp.]|uniref:NfeD family protein n=1 Tax=Armatimonas sp. TaxID=1872638 RepID=UPI00286C200A|nr:NfeD family protein [Armatimonas sp.]
MGFLAWWAQAEAFIAQPWVTILLLVAACLLLFHEMLTPLTWGLTGNLSVVFFALVLLAHAVSGVGVLVLIGGVALLLVETHLLPGRGIAAFVGFGLIFGGIYLSLSDGPKHLNSAFSLATAAAVTVFSVVTFLAYLPKSPVWKQLGRELYAQSVGAEFVRDLPQDWLGKRGQVATPLRPVGVVVIEGRQLTVVTEGDFLEPGIEVQITEIIGDRIVVDPIAALATA